jgi:hypothetical protein
MEKEVLQLPIPEYNVQHAPLDQRTHHMPPKLRSNCLAYDPYLDEYPVMGE